MSLQQRVRCRSRFLSIVGVAPVWEQGPIWREQNLVHRTLRVAEKVLRGNACNY